MDQSSRPASAPNLHEILDHTEVHQRFEFYPMWSSFRLRRYGQVFLERALGFVPKAFRDEVVQKDSIMEDKDKSLDDQFSELRSKVEEHLREFFVTSDLTLKQRFGLWGATFPIFVGVWFLGVLGVQMFFPGSGMFKDFLLNMSGPFLFLFYAEVIFPRVKTRYLTRQQLQDFNLDRFDELVPEGDPETQLEFISDILPERLTDSIGQSTTQIGQLEARIRRLDGLRADLLQGGNLSQEMMELQEKRLSRMIQGYRNDLVELEDFKTKLITLNEQFQNLAESLRRTIEQGKVIEIIDEEEVKFSANQGKVEAMVQQQCEDIESVVREIQHMLETTDIEVRLKAGDFKALDG